MEHWTTYYYHGYLLGDRSCLFTHDSYYSAYFWTRVAFWE